MLPITACLLGLLYPSYLLLKRAKDLLLDGIYVRDADWDAGLFTRRRQASKKAKKAGALYASEDRSLDC